MIGKKKISVQSGKEAIIGEFSDGTILALV
jgi:hypothetical protein